MQEVSLREKIETHTATVAVVGLGYVGTPLAKLALESGFSVIGIDPLKKNTPETLNDFPHFRFERSYKAISHADLVVICVPTPITANEVPDLSYLETAIDGVSGNFLAEDHVIPKLLILESTSFPGTTREMMLPALENEGLEQGKDFFLCYVPERIDPGPQGMEAGRIPRVVGGIDEVSTSLGASFYASCGCKVHEVSRPETAEMSKILENVFRAVNIALVNELSLLCRRMDINIWEVVEAAATKPFGFMPFKPGPGMGGHCIPVDPFYLSWRAKQFGFYTEFIELAGKINRSMPYHVVEWIAGALNSNGRAIRESNVLIVGVAYKEDVPDTRESPALKVIELLEKGGANVSYHDPYVETLEVAGKKYKSRELTAEAIRKADCVVILTAHRAIDFGMLLEVKTPVVDTRNALGALKKHS